MRTKILVLLSAAFVLSANLRAQVTIGSVNAPKEGAILDLNNGAKGGLILSNVNINDPEVIPSGFAGMDGVDIATAKAQLPGALVYNLNENTCSGILVWDGVRWKRLGLEENPATGTQSVKIVSPEESQILGGDVVRFEIESPPADTKMYTWYVSENNGATYEYAVTKTTNSFSKEFAAGNYRVKAVLDDCHSLEASLVKSFATKSVSPYFGHTGGGNTIYIYGNYPYAATSAYVQSGLVGHFDGINNTGDGDKYHSADNTDGWKNLVTGQMVSRNANTPTGDGGWKSNGWKVTADAGFWADAIPDGFPLGQSDNTIEIIYTTPAGGIVIETSPSIAHRKGLFGYGDLSIGATGGPTDPAYEKRKSFQYDRHQLFAPDNWSCNVVYTNSSHPELFQGDKLISLSVSSKGGVTLDSPDASIAYFSGVKATPASINNCIPNITSGQFFLGGYDPAKVSGYVSTPAWTIHSLRIYDRVLSATEIAGNATIDKVRYLAPPKVEIGGQPCTDVVVLSSNFLMCTVPSSTTTGDKDIVVKSPDDLTTYTSIQNGYTYVDNSSFYISSISSITGGAGDVITFTGNKLDQITEVKAGGKEWAIQTKDLTTCVCQLPADLGGLTGEVDIMITANGTEYRFARMFEYKE